MTFSQFLAESSMSELDAIIQDAYDEVGDEGGGTSAIVMKKVEAAIRDLGLDPKKTEAMIRIATKSIIG